MGRPVLKILILIIIISCDKPNENIITLGFQKDLFPEGIAVDSNSGTLFINSLKFDKIVSCRLDGNNAKDFINSHQHNCLAGFGMTVKGDTLYALSNRLSKSNSQSVLIL